MDELEKSFDTFAGKVKIEVTEDTMTPFGGLVPWSAFIKKSNIFKVLADSSPVIRTSNNASKVDDILTGFSLTSLCEELVIICSNSDTVSFTKRLYSGLGPYGYNQIRRSRGCRCWIQPCQARQK